jgi:hypothetical protein
MLAFSRFLEIHYSVSTEHRGLNTSFSHPLLYHKTTNQSHNQTSATQTAVEILQQSDFTLPNSSHPHVTSLFRKRKKPRSTTSVYKKCNTSKVHSIHPSFVFSHLHNSTTALHPSRIYLLRTETAHLKQENHEPRTPRCSLPTYNAKRVCLPLGTYQPYQCTKKALLPGTIPPHNYTTTTQTNFPPPPITHGKLLHPTL